MAGDWIKMRVSLREDPDVIAISDGLDLGQSEVVGLLHMIWSWADIHTEEGNAPGVSKAWVDRYVCVSGFANEMEKRNWLGVTEVGIYIPNFDRHNGKSAKKRAQTAKRVAKAAAKSTNAASVSKALTEKSRVEKSIKKKTIQKKAVYEEIYQAFPSRRRGGREGAYRKIADAIEKIAKSDVENTGGEEPAQWLLGRVRYVASRYEPWPADQLNKLKMLPSWMFNGDYSASDDFWERGEQSAAQAKPCGSGLPADMEDNWE